MNSNDEIHDTLYYIVIVLGLDENKISRYVKYKPLGSKGEEKFLDGGNYL